MQNVVMDPGSFAASLTFSISMVIGAGIYVYGMLRKGRRDRAPLTPVKE